MDTRTERTETFSVNSNLIVNNQFSVEKINIFYETSDFTILSWGVFIEFNIQLKTFTTAMKLLKAMSIMNCNDFFKGDTIFKHKHFNTVVAVVTRFQLL